MNTLHSSSAEEKSDWFSGFLRGIFIGVPLILICLIGFCVAYYLTKREDKEKLRVERRKAYAHQHPSPISL